MSWLESLGNKLAPKSSSPAASAAPTNGPTAKASAQTAGASGATDPNAGKTLAELDPLSAFKMWDNSPESSDKAPQFILDDAALDGATKQLDFTKGLDLAVMEGVQRGEAKAIQQMIAHTSAQAYRTAMQHSSALTGRFTEAREAHRDKSFGTRVRGELTTEALSDTPNYSHPVVRKQLQQVATQMQLQHPDASPKEIATMSKDYLFQLTDAMRPASKAGATPKGQTDWDDFFGSSEQDAN